MLCALGGFAQINKRRCPPKRHLPVMSLMYEGSSVNGLSREITKLIKGDNYFLHFYIQAPNVTRLPRNLNKMQDLERLVIDAPKVEQLPSLKKLKGLKSLQLLKDGIFRGVVCSYGMTTNKKAPDLSRAFHFEVRNLTIQLLCTYIHIYS